MLYIPSQIHRLGLDVNSLHRLSEASKKADAEERKWMGVVRRLYQDIALDIADSLEKHGKLPETPDFLEFIVRHASSISIVGYRQAETEDDLDTRPRPKRMAKKKAPPRGVKGIMDAWDAYKKTGKAPKRQQVLADKLRDEYVKKVQDVWKHYSEPFRKGDAQTRADIIDRVQAAAKTTESRASTIVQTETTRHYNQARMDYYNQSEDVTHFLFVAIRDKATTKWCKTRQGLVYEKDSELLEKETPPIHWNCRSEILPLTPMNPSHKRIIDNMSLRRNNHTCEPLPKGWN